MPSNAAVELKGSMFTFLALKLHTSDTDAVDQAIADKVQQAPGFFANTPVVVDLSLIEDDAATDGAALLRIIREHKLVPVVASISKRDCPLAKQLDIPLVEGGSRQPQTPKKLVTKNDETSQTSLVKGAASKQPVLAGDPADESWDEGFHNEDNPDKTSAAEDNDSDTGQETSDSTADVQNAAAMSGSEVTYIVKSPKLVSRPVRSGQQVYAGDTDLVVLGSIGPGAEVIAASNIHVYGALRGRALCGVAGNTAARIFCQSLEAELVSVAGNYKVLEEIPEELRGKPAQIWYGNDKLMIEPL